MTGRSNKDVIQVDLVVSVCVKCGTEWERVRTRGNPPRYCPQCRRVRPRVRKTTGLDTNTAGYRLGLVVTTYRLAIEEAAAALRLGKTAEALAALDRVQAPRRKM